MKIKIFGIETDLKWFIFLLIKGLALVIDKFVKGESLSVDQKRATRTLNYLAVEWGKPAVESTETDIDDKGLESILSLTADTAQEGGFELVEVPELA